MSEQNTNSEIQQATIDALTDAAMSGGSAYYSQLSRVMQVYSTQVINCMAITAVNTSGAVVSQEVSLEWTELQTTMPAFSSAGGMSQFLGVAGVLAALENSISAVNEAVDPVDASFQQATVLAAAYVVGEVVSSAIIEMAGGAAVASAAVLVAAPVFGAVIAGAVAYEIIHNWDSMVNGAATVEQLLANAASSAAQAVEQWFNNTTETIDLIFHGTLESLGDYISGLGNLINSGAFPSDLAKTLSPWASKLVSLFGRVMTDPVVLDLSGNGVVLTSLSSSSAYFDLHGTGYAVKTGWVGASTGILVNSATPTSINDLFGNSSVDGFTALKALDTNSDGVINASDAGFSGLYVWVDANGDGTAGAGEVYTLSQLNITQINLSTSVVNTTVNGNLIGEVATFVYADGTTGQVAEAYFDNSTMDAEYTGTYTLNPEVLLLPNARGYGTVPDLFIAMSQDATLLAMVKALTSESVTSAITSDDAIKAIIYEWAGVEAVDPTSRGGYINAQHLAALEAFTGQAFVSTWSGTSSNPQNAHQGSTLESAWDTLFEAIKERLLVQGALASTLSGVSYDYSRDSFTGTADLASLCAGLGDATLTDNVKELSYWNFWTKFVGNLATDLGVSSSVYEASLESAFANANLPYTLTDVRNNNVFLGGGGNDTLTGNGEADYIDGGAGNDTLTGNGGSNTFVFGRGYGQDTIYNWHIDEQDSVLQFNADTLPSDVIATRSGNDLVLSIAGTTDNITLAYYFSSGGLDIVSEIKFSDSTTWDYNAITDIIMLGTPWNDNLVGDSGDNVLNGGAGNDTLTGNGGSNTFVFGRGYGQDTIYNWHVDGQDSVLQFNADTSSSDVLATRSGNALVLSIAGTTDNITLAYYFSSGGLDIVSEINFADETTWNYSTILAMLIAGTSGDDTLVGDSGDNVLDGGAGNDTLTGNGGSNTFVFGRGYGQDTIYNWHIDEQDSVLQFNADTSSSDVIATRSGNDLVLSIAGTTDNITLAYYFSSGGLDIVSEINFADETTWNYNAIADMFMAGTPGDDTLYGDERDNSLDGGAGNDTLIGKSGADVYVFGRGYGQDTIQNQFSYSVTSLINFKNDVAPSDVLIFRSDYDLVFMINGTSDKISVSYFFSSDISKISGAQFADGTYWSMEAITSRIILGTGDDNTLTALSMNGALMGCAGNDTLNGSSGDDFLDGGEGADSIYGSDGDDIAILRPFDTAVGEIIDGGAGQNTLQLNNYYTAIDINLYQDQITNFQTLEALTSLNVILTSEQLSQFSNFVVDSGSLKLTARAAGSYDLSSKQGTGQISLYGSSGDDVLVGGAVATYLDGGAGDDTYLFTQGSGSSVITDAAGTNDVLAFGSSVSSDQLWFSQSGNNLVVSVIGTSDKVTISNWYTDASYCVEEIEAANGNYLSGVDSQLTQLVSAMASYAATHTGFSAATATAMPTDPSLQSALAAAWRA